MISWLQGEKIQISEQGNRVLLVINCYGVGYEVQLLQRNLKDYDCLTEITLWIHQVTRDDGYYLFVADPNDPELHGRQIYANAVKGDYGTIEAYTGD